MPRPASLSRAVAQLLLASTVLATSSVAQSGTRLVGVTGTSPFLVTQSTGSCAQNQCVPGALPPPPPGDPFVGGTAYEPSSRGVWASNGLLITKVDPRAGCAPLCPALPMPNTSPNNPVTGLAYYAPANQLYVTDRSGVIRWYNVSPSGCVLGLAGRCIAPIPPGQILTGCAIDAVTGQIFYCSTTATSSGGTVRVAQIGAPCLPFCQFTVTTCGTAPMGPLSGLGYDACDEVLWVTDGRFSTGLSFDPINCAVLGEVQCCINTIERYIGLAVVSSTEISSGTSCTQGTCPPCATLEHWLPSDPYVGNAAFSLDLRDAPGGTLAFALFNFGPCGPPVLSPPFCAGIRVPIVPPPLSGSSGTGGTPGLCDGTATFALPIPAMTVFCGQAFCSQYLGTCPGGGLYVSNALDWVIGSP